MEVVAHGLWAAAAAIAARRSAVRVGIAWSVFWAAFPDLIAFGPGAVAGAWLRLTTGAAGSEGHLLPHVHLGPSLYPAGHSAVVFALAFAALSGAARQWILPMLGWLLHILIDIPTHSFRYYATRFLWPLSDFRVDGVAWWTPWLWVATYAALAAVFVALWRARPATSSAPPERAASAPARSSSRRSSAAPPGLRPD